MTTKIPDRANDDLLSTKSDRVAFPTLLFLDAGGGVLAKHEGPRTVAAFDATLGKVRAYLAAEKRAASGDPAAAIDLFLAKMGLGKLTFDEAKARLAKLPRRTGAQNAKIRALLADLEFASLYARQRELGRDGLANKLTDMQAEGRIPAGDRAWMFWWLLMTHAARKGELDTWAGCLDKVKALKAGDKSFQRYIDQQQKRLDAARKKAGG